MQLDPSTTAGTIIQLPDGTTAQVAHTAEAAGAQTGVHTLAEVATAVSAQNQQQQQQQQTIELAGTATGELTQDGHLIITGEDGQAYPVALNGGMITVPVPQNMYQQVVANIQSGEGIQMVQVAKGAEEQQEAQVVAATPKGLTITPVSSAASSSAAGTSGTQSASVQVSKCF